MDPITLRLFKTFGPYVLVAVISGCAGFSGAWYIQGLRITGLKQDAVAKEQAIKEANQKEADRVRKITEETNDAWLKNLDALHDCYKSGRCSVPARYRVPGPGVSPAPGITYAPTADAGLASLAEDCAATTGQLVELQQWIGKVSK